MKPDPIQPDVVAQWREWFTAGVSLREIARRSGRSFSTVAQSVGPYDTRQARSRALTKHGRTETPEWKSWMHMKSRCFTPSDAKYPDYGARGITVCDRWRDSFENFLADMGPKPSRKHTIDRIDNDGNYEPGNCRWATNREQCNNRRSNVILEFRGERMNATQWAQRLGVDPNRITARIRLGWTAERALTQPLRRTASRGPIQLFSGEAAK